MQYKFTLCAGDFRYWFRHKETKEALTKPIYMGTFIANKTKVTIDLPEELKGKENIVEIYLQRTR